MTLHPYQDDTVRAVEAGWKEARRQLIVIPTGGGKTIIFSHLANRQPGRTLIIAHREELLEQAADKLHRATGLRAEIEQADRHASQQARVVVASVQTLFRRADRWAPNHFDLVVCDEAHHVLSASWQQVLGHFHDHARVLGVTATPDRADQKLLASYFERVAHEVTLIDLIRAGFLSPISIQAVPLEIDLRGVKQQAGDFHAADLGHALEPYLDAIAQALRKHAGGRRTLAFLPLIATSKKFTEACVRAGFVAEHVDGVDLERAAKLERFAGWETQVLSNAMLLTEGFDDPGIDCVLCLRPTRSRPLYAQMIGRGTRRDVLKDNLLLLDFLWLHEKHSITRPAHLVAKTDEEAESMGGSEDHGPQDLIDTFDRANEARERTLAEKLAKLRNRQAKTISAADFALQHHDLALAEYQPVMPWEGRQATDKQLDVIIRAGIDPESVSGRGHASKLIDRIYREQRLTLASYPQRALLERLGHPSPGTASVADFKAYMARQTARR